MLFNSLEFLLLFLPIALLGFFWLGRFGKTIGTSWLAACSLFFYGWWDSRYLVLLLLSIGLNYLAGRAIAQRAGSRAGKQLLTTAVVINLCLLAYYKYAGFFVSSVASLVGQSWPALSIVLPLGISFFTFTQIAFLVDAYRGKAAEYRFSYYALFVTYFPHLIAGPILHHKEMMPQFDRDRNYRPRLTNFEVGSAIFIIGLAKKVLLADNLAPYANAVFASPEPQSLLVVWGGVLAYTFQLYFDFSGYSDMAIGISRLFGIRLPLNFNSPYKSVNITEFWRCWHMTLSRFLRDYLYIPLGGNRHGPWRQKLNLMLTMLLGGLWHGAGWNFVIWGGLHGLYLTINHAWRAWCQQHGWQLDNRPSRAAGVLLTFVCVVIAWVFFRAANLDAALDLLAGMAGTHGVALPDALAGKLGLNAELLQRLGIQTFFGGGASFVLTYVWVALAMLVAFCLPNTQQLLHRFAPALPEDNQHIEAGLWAWRPRWSWALGLGVLAVASLISIGRPSEFLYFQF